MPTSSYPQKIISLLRKEYPKQEKYLITATPLQTLVATILSAQARDDAVNKITPAIFKKYKTAEDYANSNPAELRKMISSITFFNNKTKNIRQAAKVLVEKFSGRVPKTIEDLVEIPGVGRKTANVILTKSYGIVSGIVVDTHVIRLSQRLGLSKNSNPVKIENDLMQIYPKSEWESIANLLKAHGRAICKAPTPFCSKCVLNKVCPKIGVKKYN